MKKLSLSLIFVVFGIFGLKAQGFADLTNRKGNAFEDNNFELMLRRTQVSGKYTESFGGTTLNMKWRADHYDRGRSRWHFENPTLGDMLFVVTKMLSGKDYSAGQENTEQSFGSGFFGWHQVYGNVIATDRMLLSVGASFGDYIFATKRAPGTTGFSQQILDPAGYYFHLGPAIMFTHIVGNSLWLDGYTHYDIGFRASGPSTNYIHTEGYPRPGFLNVGVNIHHAKSRLWGGVRMARLIDRGPSNDAATRVDISFGYMF